MKEYDLQKLITDSAFLESTIHNFKHKKLLFSQHIDGEEIQGHFQKAEHNLRFIAKNLELGFFDWVMTGCYYASYHAVLALILTKGHTSKNHYATLCVLIKEFYNKEITYEDLELFTACLDYQDLLFYVESKHKRENASYSTTTAFNKKIVEQLIIKTQLFINNIKNILMNERFL